MCYYIDHQEMPLGAVIGSTKEHQMDGWYSTVVPSFSGQWATNTGWWAMLTLMAPCTKKRMRDWILTKWIVALG
jgi:hypothetical protein